MATSRLRNSADDDAGVEADAFEAPAEFSDGSEDQDGEPQQPKDAAEGVAAEPSRDLEQSAREPPGPPADEPPRDLEPSGGEVEAEDGDEGGDSADDAAPSGAATWKPKLEPSEGHRPPPGYAAKEVEEASEASGRPARRGRKGLPAAKDAAAPFYARVFEELDEEHTGTVVLADFKQAFHLQHVRDEMVKLGVNSQDLDVLFKILDRGGAKRGQAAEVPKEGDGPKKLTLEVLAKAAKEAPEEARLQVPRDNRYFLHDCREGDPNDPGSPGAPGEDDGAEELKGKGKGKDRGKDRGDRGSPDDDGAWGHDKFEELMAELDAGGRGAKPQRRRDAPSRWEEDEQWTAPSRSKGGGKGKGKGKGGKGGKGKGGWQWVEESWEDNAEAWPAPGAWEGGRRRAGKGKGRDARDDEDYEEEAWERPSHRIAGKGKSRGAANEEDYEEEAWEKPSRRTAGKGKSRGAANEEAYEEEAWERPSRQSAGKGKSRGAANEEAYEEEAWERPSRGKGKSRSTANEDWDAPSAWSAWDNGWNGGWEGGRGGGKEGQARGRGDHDYDRGDPRKDRDYDRGETRGGNFGHDDRGGGRDRNTRGAKGGGGKGRAGGDHDYDREEHPPPPPSSSSPQKPRRYMQMEF